MLFLCVCLSACVYVVVWCVCGFVFGAVWAEGWDLCQIFPLSRLYSGYPFSSFHCLLCGTFLVLWFLMGWFVASLAMVGFVVEFALALSDSANTLCSW